MPKESKHILVIRLSAMGDVAMTVPILRALLQQHPKVKITVLTRTFFAPFFRDLVGVTVYSAEVKGKHKGVFGLFKLAQELNKNKFYAIADLHNVLRSKILKRFLKCKQFVSIYKGRNEKHELTSGKKFEQLKTTHQRYADVFETLGFKIDLSNPNFPEKVILNDKLQSFLGSPTRKAIGIAPFAAHEGKMYPLDLMEKVIKVLSKDYTVILFGGGHNEIAILNDFESTFEYVVSVAGKLDLNEEMDLISNLDVMLSMDSGNAHIAAMLGIKVITIWGVTHPYAGFMPFNQDKDNALLSDRNQFPLIPTSVYGNKYPENYKNVSGSILPSQVIEKVKSML
ncbi:glycosyltransferase family 9 protein [Tamlana sp. 2201CG12-4]|uniref:glycosyltransferase family 9 protein n=1 Tax=Tamlana sp. 2201CG12-4 TaxID=3112582 RepID=UPI002DB58FF6|nr:glycosyltransferase family 9 protein [Tamlana sp. 2201CG12-4]MEC3906323.1 glycosyltransferase family 9 protein [Tamlana sp. 2201CG12-4]